jgi:arginase
LQYSYRSTVGLERKWKLRPNFLDAHADFYQSEKSISGEVADMDLAIVTGQGPEILKNINNLHPYVKDENVIHIEQRDWEETKNSDHRISGKLL